MIHQSKHPHPLEVENWGGGTFGKYYIFPHKIVWGSCFLDLYLPPPPTMFVTLSHTIFHTPSFTHIFVSHIIFHTHLCHTPSLSHHLSHTIFHIQLCHSLSHIHLCNTPSLSHHLCFTPSFTHIFVSHIIFHRHLCHTPHTIYLTPSFTHISPLLFCVAGVALNGTGLGLVARLGPLGRPWLRGTFVWQAWHLATSTCIRGTWRHRPSWKGWFFANLDTHIHNYMYDSRLAGAPNIAIVQQKATWPPSGLHFINSPFQTIPSQLP